jgi:hypothetical protein
LITAITPDGQALRTVLDHLLASHPQVERTIAEKLAAPDVTYTSPDPATHPLVGTRTPVPEPDSILFRPLRGGRPALLDLSDRGGLGRAVEHALAIGIETQPSLLAETGGQECPVLVRQSSGRTDRSGRLSTTPPRTWNRRWSKASTA